MTGHLTVASLTSSQLLTQKRFAGDKEVTDEDIDRAMTQMDADGSGEVDFDECVHHSYCNSQRVTWLLQHVVLLKMSILQYLTVAAY